MIPITIPSAEGYRIADCTGTRDGAATMPGARGVLTDVLTTLPTDCASEARARVATRLKGSMG